MKLTIIVEYERTEGMNRAREEVATEVAALLEGEEVEESLFTITEAYPA